MSRAGQHCYRISTAMLWAIRSAASWVNCSIHTPRIPPNSVGRRYWVSRPMYWREMSMARSEKWTSDGPRPAMRLA